MPIKRLAINEPAFTAVVGSNSIQKIVSKFIRPGLFWWLWWEHSKSKTNDQNVKKLLKYSWQIYMKHILKSCMNLKVKCYEYKISN